MSISHINSTAQSYIDLVARYKVDQQAIYANKDTTSDAKNRFNKELRGRYHDAAVNLYVPFWGGLVASDRADLGTEMLDPSASAWRNLRDTMNAVNNAKQTAEREGIDIQWAAYAADRARSIIANMTVMNPSSGAGNSNVMARWLASQYEAAPKEVRNALQDLGGMLLAEYGGVEFNSFKSRLERDRAARVNTPAVQRAVQEHIDTLNALEQCYRATQNMVNELGAGQFSVTPTALNTLFSMIGHKSYVQTEEFGTVPHFERGYRGMREYNGTRSISAGVAFGG